MRGCLNSMTWGDLEVYQNSVSFLIRTINYGEMIDRESVQRQHTMYAMSCTQLCKANPAKIVFVAFIRIKKRDYSVEIWLPRLRIFYAVPLA